MQTVVLDTFTFGHGHGEGKSQDCPQQEYHHSWRSRAETSAVKVCECPPTKIASNYSDPYRGWRRRWLRSVVQRWWLAVLQWTTTRWRPRRLVRPFIASAQRLAVKTGKRGLTQNAFQLRRNTSLKPLPLTGAKAPLTARRKNPRVSDGHSIESLLSEPE